MVHASSLIVPAASVLVLQASLVAGLTIPVARGLGAQARAAASLAVAAPLNQNLPKRTNLEEELLERDFDQNLLERDLEQRANAAKITKAVFKTGVPIRKRFFARGDFDDSDLLERGMDKELSQRSGTNYGKIAKSIFKAGKSVAKHRSHSSNSKSSFKSSNPSRSKHGKHTSTGNIVKQGTSVVHHAISAVKDHKSDKLAAQAAAQSVQSAPSAPSAPSVQVQPEIPPNAGINSMRRDLGDEEFIALAQRSMGELDDLE